MSKIKTQHCELCNCLLPLPFIKQCGRCMDLCDNIDMLAGRRDEARAVLLSMLLTPSMVAALAEVEDAAGYGELGEIDLSMFEGWRQLAAIALAKQLEGAET